MEARIEFQSRTASRGGKFGEDVEQRLAVPLASIGFVDDQFADVANARLLPQAVTDRHRREADNPAAHLTAEGEVVRCLQLRANGHAHLFEVE